ncbi:HEAT repeat domain-containing protein [Microbacterium sp. SORGH_AS_0888]|uniref:HEAT repeat domain-containing protein n=1 Tax=Microbacterium sp. SORGH_AS_0888 TaxID=3041791 RepID=UPI0027D8DFB8|nr:HEAT repeat domain-containing protein [Microbacterium sp. SORGH_AS_0888]
MSTRVSVMRVTTAVRRFAPWRSFGGVATGADWRAELSARAPADWPAYLDANSGLPGPRANLTLVQAVAIAADAEAIEVLLADGGEYAVLCAAAAIGARADEAAREPAARALAVDERWRVREGVALGLQLLGDRDPAGLIEIVRRWVDDPDPLVERAAVAAICEPRLLRSPDAAAAAIEVCRRATRNLVALPPERRKRADARTLRQALGYCWSVAVAADPAAGLDVFLALDASDPDVAWIVDQNRRKKRLASLLP